MNTEPRHILRNAILHDKDDYSRNMSTVHFRNPTTKESKFEPGPSSCHLGDSQY